jgi:hypothetical protein
MAIYRWATRLTQRAPWLCVPLSQEVCLFDCNFMIDDDPIQRACQEAFVIFDKNDPDSVGLHRVWLSMISSTWPWNWLPRAQAMRRTEMIGASQSQPPTRQNFWRLRDRWSSPCPLAFGLRDAGWKSVCGVDLDPH